MVGFEHIKHLVGGLIFFIKQNSNLSLNLIQIFIAFAVQVCRNMVHISYSVALEFT